MKTEEEFYQLRQWEEQMMEVHREDWRNLRRGVKTATLFWLIVVGIVVAVLYLK
jgi:hypothetical protein